MDFRSIVRGVCLRECLDLWDPVTEYRVAGELARVYLGDDPEKFRADARRVIQTLYAEGAFTHGPAPW